MKSDSSRFSDGAYRATVASMQVIRDSFERRSALDVQVKECDKTLVTVLDHASEAACVRILQRYFPNVSILREEGGLSTGSANWIIWVDALDGTTARTLDIPTSTVIIAAYSLTEKCLQAVYIGEPTYQRIWHADNKARITSSCWVTRLTNRQSTQCCVWQGELSEQASVFINVSH